MLYVALAMPTQEMGPATAAALGALQGLTEFLPISSSGHVAIAAFLFGLRDMPLAMIVLLHAGTLLATLLVVGRDVGRLAAATLRGLGDPRGFVSSDAGRIVGGVALASVPTAILGLMLKAPVERWSHMPRAVGAFMLVTAAVLLATQLGRGNRSIPGPGACLLIGIAQGLAVIPGISRSGATIAAAMMLGVRGPDAFRFSFLLSLPAVAGALLLQLADPGQLQQLGWPAWLGGGIALVTGYAALLVLRKIVARGRLWAFALYLVPVGGILVLGEAVLGW